MFFRPMLPSLVPLSDLLLISMLAGLWYSCFVGYICNYNSPIYTRLPNYPLSNFTASYNPIRAESLFNRWGGPRITGGGPKFFLASTGGGPTFFLAYTGGVQSFFSEPVGGSKVFLVNHWGVQSFFGVPIILNIFC